MDTKIIRKKTCPYYEDTTIHTFGSKKKKINFKKCNMYIAKKIGSSVLVNSSKKSGEKCCICDKY